MRAFRRDGAVSWPPGRREQARAFANDFRLTLASGVPYVLPNTAYALPSTVYLTPLGRGNRLELYEGTRRGWQVRSTAEISVAVPSTLFRLFDVFAYWNSMTRAVTLEATNWDQSTAALTAATAATPSVITSTAHGLSNGDLVGLAGLNNTVGTDATDGLNGTVWRVASVAANTFEPEGSKCAGLVASTTGTWYKIPNTRTTALVAQDGRWCKTGDLSRLYLGSGMTMGVSGESETNFGGVDTPANWLLQNYYNRVEVVLRYSDSTDSWTYTTAAFRPANGRGKRARLGIVIGVNEEMVDAEAVHAATDSSAVPGATTVILGIDLDGFATNDAQRLAIVAATGNVVPMAARYVGFPGIGAHFLGWIEYSDGAGLGVTTWYGDAGLAQQFTGIMARWRA